MPDIGGYQFEGPYHDAGEIQLRAGVYAIVCIVKGDLHCLLDVGTSGQLKERLKSHHNRQDCWREHTHGDIGYCVKYTNSTTDVHHRDHAPPPGRRADNEEPAERIMIEDEIFWKYDIPCGTNHWKEKERAIARYNAYERLFGPRGHEEIA